MDNQFGMQGEMQSWKTDLWTHCSKGIGNIPSMQQIAIAMECSSEIGFGVGEEAQVGDQRTAQKGGSPVFTNN